MDVLAFVGVVAVIVVVPGPDMALVLQNGLARGRRAAVETALGINAGLVVWAVAAALGVAALLHASAPAFTALKLAGAAYLVWLGVRALAGRLAGDGWRSAVPVARADGIPLHAGPAVEPPESEDRPRLHDADPAVPRSGGTGRRADASPRRHLHLHGPALADLVRTARREGGRAPEAPGRPACAERGHRHRPRRVGREAGGRAAVVRGNGPAGASVPTGVLPRQAAVLSV